MFPGIPDEEYDRILEALEACLKDPLRGGTGELELIPRIPAFFELISYILVQKINPSARRPRLQHNGQIANTLAIEGDIPIFNGKQQSTSRSRHKRQSVVYIMTFTA